MKKDKSIKGKKYKYGKRIQDMEYSLKWIETKYCKLYNMDQWSILDKESWRDRISYIKINISRESWNVCMWETERIGEK